MKSIHSYTAAQMAWTNLKEVLEAMRDGSDLFSPLKAALVGVTAIMDSIEVRCVSESLLKARLADSVQWPCSVLEMSRTSL
jgi:hypothetical protein